MRLRVRKLAHVLERTGLAMAGAASGLFVAAHVGSAIAAFTFEMNYATLFHELKRALPKMQMQNL